MRNGDETQPHVLVVDDYPGMAKKLGGLLERAGFRVSCAFGGSEAVAVFNAALSAGRPFSAVVTDFRMPDLDGLAVAAAVKAASPATAVVLITAFDADDHSVPNVDAVLRKPTSEALLSSTLTRLVVDPGER